MGHNSIWRLAVSPKWIGGLLIALAAASLFAWLGQWQLGRAVESNQPIQIVKSETVDVMLDSQSSYVVRNRIQDGKNGYWVIANFTTADNEAIVMALGWTSDYAKAAAARDGIRGSMVAQAYLPVTGVKLPSEAPMKIEKDEILGSVSTAQIANLVSGKQKMRADYLAVGSKSTEFGLEPIHADISQEAGVNWLSAFYAIEWTVFAGFAVFMWWRLLKDAHLARRLN